MALSRHFGDVLDRIKEATKAHPQFKKGPVVESETRFRYVFANPGDSNREVFLTVLAFDVPT